MNPNVAPAYQALLERCELCPRACGVNRLAGEVGVCGADDKVHVARAALHMWEEPPISGDDGSGAIFFSHCNLKCRFCQNHDISTDGFGLPVTTERLARIMVELRDQGARNINLVTPTHYVPQILTAIPMARSQGMELPMVCNTGSYDAPGTIGLLARQVDVWLPDYKYADARLAADLSAAGDYPERALEALRVMVGSVRAAGGRLVDDDGYMRRGVIVRHLVLPDQVPNSLRALQALWDEFGDDIDVSIMSQYTPLHEPSWYGAYPGLGRTLQEEEYEAVLDFADILGFTNVWWQEGGAATESFIPAFDTSGVLAPAGGDAHVR